jgi:uncharacterized membrane protein (UPF0127 family)
MELADYTFKTEKDFSLEINYDLDTELDEDDSFKKGPCNTEECPHFECDNADTVLEVPGGLCDTWNINEGDSVKIG